MATPARELIDITLSFLEVIIHGILFYRRVYPAGLFERRRSYGMAVWMSRHPGLNDSIHRVLHSLHAALLKGAVEAVCVAILDASGRAVEQYTLDISLSAPDVPATYSDLETMLAAAVTKLALLDGPDLGEDATFTVLAKMHEVCVGPHDSSSAADGVDAAAPASAGGASVLLKPGGLWLRVDPGDPEAVLTPAAASSGGAAVAAPSAGHKGPSRGGVRVIKTVRAGALLLQLHSVAVA